MADSIYKISPTFNFKKVPEIDVNEEDVMNYKLNQIEDIVKDTLCASMNKKLFSSNTKTSPSWFYGTKTKYPFNENLEGVKSEEYLEIKSRPTVPGFMITLNCNISNPNRLIARNVVDVLEDIVKSDITDMGISSILKEKRRREKETQIDYSKSKKRTPKPI